MEEISPVLMILIFGIIMFGIGFFFGNKRR
jgi:hypothetical protein